MTRLVVLGGGLIGRRHVERIIAHPNAEIAGLVDPDPSVASDLNVPRLSSLADIDQADGVIIATPTPLHAEHAIAVAKRGLPMLIEKPVAATLGEADHLQKTVSNTGVSVLVGHHRRHHPKAQALKEMMAEIGQVVTVTLIWAMRKPDAYFAGNWRTDAGSPVMINLVHDLDLLRYWFGEITEVTALPGALLRGSGRIESGAVALRFGSGTVATISFADTAPSPWGFEAGTGENPNIGFTEQDMMWVAGTKGGLSFPSLTMWQGVDWALPAQAVASPHVPDLAPLDVQLDHFLDVIAGRAAPICSLADGRAALDIALQIENQLASKAA